ncbi:hypothetical protein K2173_023993 [Erythroxylum novogranatense]|uniref:F-box domain-containing protein n=1 Tax=Erythroxylum novogranatense TaxID=1862640 RepID=A0AAV8TS32_9ROSI|nr:hypothetical protein K2173_023993 [Erythroxylum novogranatense]
MKLRLRSLETKETHKIEVPNTATLRQLGETLALSISSASSSPLPLSTSLRFSLNRKDELIASSPEESLKSLGITSGDLIYFSVTAGGVSSSSLEGVSSSSNSFGQAQAQKGNCREPISDQSVGFQKSDSLGGNMVQKHETPIGHSCVGGKGSEITDTVSNTQIEETPETLGLDDVESMDIDAGSGFRFYEPYFLRRVLREELGNYGGDHKLLVIAIHAVFLESGFAAFDPVSGAQVEGFHLPDEWPSRASTLTLWYTLPKLLGGNNVSESVVLKFQKLGQFLNVYGSLSNGSSGLHRVCLNEYRFAPTIDLVWANCDKKDRVNHGDVLSKTYPESEVFEFWKIVKDGLALPLLIDLCEKAGLDLPACLIRLPTELKLKILDSLPGIDISRMGCVCSEMRYLSSNNDVWKKKVAEEFGIGNGAQGMIDWKERYASCWESKKRKRDINARPMFRPVYRPYQFPIIRDPYPLGIPGPMIGGDYDLFPGASFPSPFGRPGQVFPRTLARRNFSLNCNLGGFNS